MTSNVVDLATLANNVVRRTGPLAQAQEVSRSYQGWDESARAARLAKPERRCCALRVPW